MRLIIISPLLFATVLLACAPMCPTCTPTGTLSSRPTCPSVAPYSLTDCNTAIGKTCYKATITGSEVKCSNPASQIAILPSDPDSQDMRALHCIEVEGEVEWMAERLNGLYATLETPVDVAACYDD